MDTHRPPRMLYLMAGRPSGGLIVYDFSYFWPTMACLTSRWFFCFLLFTICRPFDRATSFLSYFIGSTPATAFG